MNMFNSEYVFDPATLDLPSLTRRGTSFPKKLSLSSIPEDILVRQETADLRREVQQRRKIWNAKPNTTALSNNVTTGKELLSLRSRARSLIQLPPNPQSISNGFFAFSELNSKNKLQVRMQLNDFPIRRQFVKTHTNPMKDVVNAEMLYNKSQATSIQNFNQQLFHKTVHSFQSFCKRRLSSLEYQRKHLKVRSKDNQQKSQKPDELTFEFNEGVFYGNRQGWKPAIGEDSIVLFEDDKVYYFGGRNRTIPMPVYNMQTNKWKEQSQLKQCYFLSGTTALPHNGCHIVFGGEYPIINARTKTLTSKVFSINLPGGTMEQLNVSDALEARRCHSSCIYGNYLVVFGGINTGYAFLRQLSALNLTDLKWEDIQYTCSPDVSKYLRAGIAKFKALPVFNKRSNMSLYDFNSPPLTTTAYLQEGIYLFGGLNQQGNAMNRLLVITLGQFSPRIIEPKTKGLPPEPRYDYGMCRWRDNMVIHGGRNDERNPHIYSDCYMLGLTSLYWTKVVLTETNERFCHELTVRGRDQIWLFGGKDLKGHTKDVTCYNVVA